MSKRNWLILVALVVAVGLFAAFGMKRDKGPVYSTVKVDRGDVRQVVEATGTINAVTSVQVGSQVSGSIAKLFADFNSHVKKDQVIAQIDPSLFQGNLLQAKADLENARANYSAAQSNLLKARATAEQARTEYERTKALSQQGVFSQQQLDVAKSNADSANASVSAAQAQVTQAAAQTSQRKAAVDVAQTNLAHTTIRAPIDGVVVNRNVDVGQTVAAAMQAPTLFTIAQDLTKMQVYTKTDESDVGQIRSGQQVSFKVDAFPRDTFRGRVVQVRMNATTVQNVVTYDTIIEFDNPDLKLFPGMTAYVTIPVATAQNTLKVPNGALRYKPDMKPEEIRAAYTKAGIDFLGGGGAGSGAGGGSPAAGGGSSAPAGEGRGGNAGARGGQGNRGASGASAGQAPAGGGDGATGGRRGGNPDGGAPGGGSDRGAPRMDMAVVWKLLPDKTIVPVRVKTGITDHTVTEVKDVVNGDLKEGDDVVTGASTAKGSSVPGLGGARPGGGGGPGGGGPPRR